MDISECETIALYGFASGIGLPITVGAIIALLTGLYNWLSTRHADRNRKFTEHIEDDDMKMPLS